jgi:hypothetical protein
LKILVWSDVWLLNPKASNCEAVRFCSFVTWVVSNIGMLTCYPAAVLLMIVIAKDKVADVTGL